MKKKLIIGCGTGRCGTVSLYRLLNFQRDSFFVHESEPLLTWEFDKEAIDLKLGRLLGKKERYVGDVSSAFLPYLDYICGRYTGVRVVVLKRARGEVVKSFVWKTRKVGWNLWGKFGGEKGGKWADMHPKYDCDSKEEALGMYWDNYYRDVKKLVLKYPDNVRVFAMRDLNSKKGVKGILDFCGILNEDRKIEVGAKENCSGGKLNSVRYTFWRANKI